MTYFAAREKSIFSRIFYLHNEIHTKVPRTEIEITPKASQEPCHVSSIINRNGCYSKLIWQDLSTATVAISNSLLTNMCNCECLIFQRTLNLLNHDQIPKQVTSYFNNICSWKFINWKKFERLRFKKMLSKTKWIKFIQVTGSTIVKYHA